MVLKIVMYKTDYTPLELSYVAQIMIEKADLFVDNGETGTLEASFSEMSKLAQARRSILKFVVN